MPQHVLQRTIPPHTTNVDRVDSYSVLLFHRFAGEEYGRLEETGGSKLIARTAGMRRIHRAKSKDAIIESLTSPELGVFKEIWRLLLFAAQVGVANSRREALGNFDSGKGIDQSTFGNCPSWPGILFVMGVAETGDSSSLANAQDTENARIQRFEEYANGGLSVIEEFMEGSIVDLDAILAFLDSQSSHRAENVDLDFTI